MDELDKKVYDVFSGRVVKRVQRNLLKEHRMFRPMYWNTYWGHIAPLMTIKKLRME